MFDDGVSAGLVFAVLLPGTPSWRMLRGREPESHRGRGIGHALYAAIVSNLCSQMIRRVNELDIGA